jgi:hypothetical protein
MRANTFAVAFNSLEYWDVRRLEARYRFRYAVRADPSGGRTGYILAAQPVSYNEDGVRSYFIDEEGTLRATSDNRVATGSDPELAKCEAFSGIQCLDIIPSFSSNSPGATSKVAQ